MHAPKYLAALALGLLLAATGCGPPEPQPLTIESDGTTSLSAGAPYILPANTRLEALNKCTISFPGEGLFEPGDVIGEVVDIDNDALIELAPNDEKVSVRLETGQSMVITKPRTITVELPADTASRFKVVQPGT